MNNFHYLPPSSYGLTPTYTSSWRRKAMDLYPNTAKFSLETLQVHFAISEKQVRQISKFHSLPSDPTQFTNILISGSKQYDWHCEREAGWILSNPIIRKSFSSVSAECRLAGSSSQTTK